MGIELMIDVFHLLGAFRFRSPRHPLGRCHPTKSYISLWNCFGLKGISSSLPTVCLNPAPMPAQQNSGESLQLYHFHAAAPQFTQSHTALQCRLLTVCCEQSWLSKRFMPTCSLPHNPHCFQIQFREQFKCK